MTTHVTKSGDPKLVERCSYPLTAQAVVTRVYSDLAIIDVSDGHFRLEQLAPDTTVQDVERQTGASLRVMGD
jgi:3-oxoadipate CoA-transferase beta subunit